MAKNLRLTTSLGGCKQTTHHQLTRGHDWWPESWGSVSYPSAFKMFDTDPSTGVVMVMPLSWQTHEEEVTGSIPVSYGGVRKLTEKI